MSLYWFNTLPSYINSILMCGVIDFKDKLDKYLSQIPDQPKISNSLKLVTKSIEIPEEDEETIEALNL